MLHHLDRDWLAIFLLLLVIVCALTAVFLFTQDNAALVPHPPVLVTPTSHNVDKRT